MRNYRQPAQLLRNLGGPNHWVEFRLVGTRSNRDAVGARVRVLAGGRWQTRVVAAGSGFLSAHSLVQHVGLGPASTVERAEIDWPAGHRTVHGPLPGDRRHEIREETP
jgi:hypothetical protein